MPAPEDLGPLGAHLVGEDFTSCRGRVLFAGGSEVSVIDEPRLIEVVRCDEAWGSGAASAPQLMAAATTIALSPAEANQVSGGGSNARFGTLFDSSPTDDLPSGVPRTCAVVSDRPEVAATVSGALAARGVACHTVDSPTALAGIDALDAVVVALAGTRPTAGATSGWEQILAEHDGIVERIDADAQWTRAVAEFAATDGSSDPLGDHHRRHYRRRPQPSPGHRHSSPERAARLPATWSCPSPSAPNPSDVPAELVAHLVCSAEAVGIAGAELVSAAGWFGLRSHPRPIGSISFGGPAIPGWFDDTLEEVVQPK